MTEFLVVVAGVAVVMATRWDHSSRRGLGFSGALSMALGLRVAALATATYVLPLLPSTLSAEEANPTAVQAVEGTAESTPEKPAETKTAEQPAAEVPEQAPKPEGVAEVEKNSLSEPKPEVKTTAEPKVEAEAPATQNPSTAEKPAGSNSEIDSSTSVAFITNVKYLTPNRPDWLETLPDYEGDDFVVAVRAGPYRTVRDCQPDLESEVQTAVSDFIKTHLRAPHATKFINFSSQDLRARNVIREQFSERLETSLGLMNQVHAKLVFDDAFRDELDGRWSEIKSQSRLAQTGLGAGVLLLFLGTLFSFLKLDTATKGYYTGRLQFGAAATILTLVAASVVLAKWIPWM